MRTMARSEEKTGEIKRKTQNRGKERQKRSRSKRVRKGVRTDVKGMEEKGR